MNNFVKGTSWSTADFESISWHDNYVHGIRFRYAEAPEYVMEVKGKKVICSDEPDLSQLIFDIDVLLPHSGCTKLGFGVSVVTEFLIAPAELVFTEVYDLKMKLGPSPKGPVCGMGIDNVTRKPRKYAAEPKDFFSWVINFSHPRGTISFHAAGFTQQLLAAPVKSEMLRLDDATRDRLLRGR